MNLDRHNEKTAHLIIPLTIQEAEKLYILSNNIKCQKNTNVDNYDKHDKHDKYDKHNKHIWWAKKDAHNEIEYVLCQNCYHNEKNQNNNNITEKNIIDNLVPILVLNYSCECQGNIGYNQKSSEPINIYRDWTLDVYINKNKINAEYKYITKTKSQVRIVHKTKNKFTLSFNISGVHMNNNIMAEIYDNKILHQPIYTINNNTHDNYKNIILDCIEHNGEQPFIFCNKEKTIQILFYSGIKIIGDITTYKLLFTINLIICPEYVMHDVANTKTIFI